MGQKELIQRILKEETIIPIKARRYVSQLDDYYEYEFNLAKRYVFKYKNRQRFINYFINELFERFYQGWLSNNIKRFTDEFEIMKDYVKLYVLDKRIKQLDYIWFRTHKDS